MFVPAKNKSPSRPAGERSFTLVETMIALGLMVTVILEVSTVQGRAILFNEYNRKVTQAAWLANAVMAKVEWGKDYYELKEIKVEARDQDFDEVLCPKDPKFGCDFKYNIAVAKFPLPLVDYLGEALLGAEGKNSPLAGMLDLVKGQLKEMLGEDFLKVAEVEVFWPAGSQRDSMKVAYLLANQLPLDDYVEQQKPLKVQQPQPGQAGAGAGAGGDTGGAAAAGDTGGAAGGGGAAAAGGTGGAAGGADAGGGTAGGGGGGGGGIDDGGGGGND